ncbi:cytochrome P450 [Fomitopsis betulina]|nr:cytochrome P450 [Fomitopsis betulina]
MDAQYKGCCFKYAELGRWCVVVTSPAAINELAKAPEDVLSSVAGNDVTRLEQLQILQALGLDVSQTPYLKQLIRTRLMRNAARMFDDIHDEAVSAFTDEVHVRAADIALEVVCRVINRVFVGRNADYLAVPKGFMMHVGISRVFIKPFPDVMKPLIARLCSLIPGRVDRASRHLGSIITERLRVADLPKGSGQHHGTDAPNDLLQWLIEGAPEGRERTVPALVLGVLIINFAALHTTSTIYTQALYYLAAHPEHAAALREEVERVVRVDGWSNASLGNMRLVDGFLKEVLRVTIGAVSMSRKAVRDYTFADGTFIPKGTMVVAATHCLHFEADRYGDPAVFDPRRYDGLSSSKDNLTTMNDHYWSFGHGQHACTGRFFAATVLKVLTAHTVVTYDVKLPGNSRSIPPPMWISTLLFPNRKANVLFRKRDVYK